MTSGNRFYAQSFLVTLLIAAVAYMSTLANGVLSLPLLFIGIAAALMDKRGVVLSCFILYPLLLTLNPLIFPLTVLGSNVNRISTFVVAVVMAIAAGKHRGSNQIPLGGIFPYLMVAGISSAQGYFPQISYFKLLNFTVFVVGLWIGTRNLQNSPKDLRILRPFIFAVAMFIIFGSAATLPFPGVAYMDMKDLVRKEGLEAANAMFREAEGGMSLFCGITNQSQCLGPMLAAAVMWVIVDMLFVERRFAKLHVLVIGVGVVLMYLTRSRTSLLTFFVGGAMLMLYAIRRVKMPSRLTRRVRNLASFGIVMMMCWAAYSEVRHQTMSKWIRKTDDTEVSWSEAVTSSRQRLIEECWADFHYNEILGCGFQVAYDHPYLYGDAEGLVLSAPIEKGLLPLMVLGETGVVGACVFVGFMVAFYAGCARKKLFATMLMFTVMVASNFGEADFFSPGGIGGTKWVLCVVGGFIIDTRLLYSRRIERRMEELRVWQTELAAY